jgi:hypothetical protein
MPSGEQVPAWARSLRAAGIPVAGLAAVSGVVVLSWLIANQRANPGDARPDLR